MQVRAHTQSLVFSALPGCLGSPSPCQYSPFLILKAVVLRPWAPQNPPGIPVKNGMLPSPHHLRACGSPRTGICAAHPPWEWNLEPRAQEWPCLLQGLLLAGAGPPELRQEEKVINVAPTTAAANSHYIAEHSPADMEVALCVRNELGVSHTHLCPRCFQSDSCQCNHRCKTCCSLCRGHHG